MDEARAASKIKIPRTATQLSVVAWSSPANPARPVTPVEVHRARPSHRPPWPAMAGGSNLKRGAIWLLSSYEERGHRVFLDVMRLHGTFTLPARSINDVQIPDSSRPLAMIEHSIYRNRNPMRVDGYFGPPHPSSFFRRVWRRKTRAANNFPTGKSTGETLRIAALAWFQDGRGWVVDRLPSQLSPVHLAILGTRLASRRLQGPEPNELPLFEA